MNRPVDRPAIDPDDLATTVRVLNQLHELPEDHPDITTVNVRNEVLSADN